MKSYYDIEGDGGSNILGQVQAQQEAIRQALSGVRQVLAVGSGKGGVGKSTVTMSLAQALRRQGAAVAILDADFNGPCQAKLAGLEGSPWVPGDRGLALPRRFDGIGVVSMGSVFPRAAAVDFEHVASGHHHTWRATREFTILGQLLSGMDWGRLDYLLLDLPPGAERTLHYADFLGPEAAFVLVTIPSDVSREVVARSRAALAGSPATLLGYVENMAGYACPGCDKIQPLFPPSETTLSLRHLGSLPFDPRLAELCDRGWPQEAALPTPATEAIDEVLGNLLDALDRASSTQPVSMETPP